MAIKQGTQGGTAGASKRPRDQAPNMSREASQRSPSESATSILSPGFFLKGDIETTGSIHLDGKVEGNIRAHSLTIGGSGAVVGDVVADEVVISGRIIGSVHGLNVQLITAANVKGDIVHKALTVQSGAVFEGTVERRDDPFDQVASQSQPNIPDTVEASVQLNMDSLMEIEKLTTAAKNFMRYLGYDLEVRHSEVEHPNVI